MYRTAKLSIASRMISQRLVSSRTFSSSIVRSNASTLVVGLILSTFCDADSTFCFPRSSSQCSTCRFKLLSSTESISISCRCPTPAAARYNARGEPSPPKPAMRAVEFFSRCCPLSPNPGMIICRWYRLRSYSDRDMNVNPQTETT